MEFRGLESYIERACPEVLIDVNLSETLALHKKEHVDREPILLVDGDSCSDWLYDSITLPGTSLGLYQELKLRWYQLIIALEGNFIRPVFIFNGFPTCETDDVLWVSKHNQKLIDFVRAKQEEGKKTLPQEIIVKFLRADLETTEFSKFILREKGCTIVQTKKGVALELTAITTLYYHIGLLAQPTRFIGIETDVTLFSIKHLNMATMDTKKYCRRALASHLGIDASYFPLLLTLCGNDIISDEDLSDFYVSLFHEYNADRHFNSWSIPPSTIIPPIEKVAEWINSERLLPDPNTWLFQVARHPNLIEIRNNICHCLSMCFTPLSIMDPNMTLPEILICAAERHRNKGIHGWILAILNRLECFNGFYFRDFLNEHTLPCSTAILQKLRMRMYGILLKDHIGEHSPVMTENLLTLPDFTRVTVDPDFPHDHPGLLKLWEESTEGEQMKMLCWAVSDKIKLDDLLKIPPKLHIACLALFYIVENDANYPHNAKNLDLEAIIVVIIRLYKMPLLNFKRAECDEAPPLFELYMANLYTQAWFHVLAVHDACGSPLLNDSKTVNSVFFDGKVFQTIRTRLVMGGTLAPDLSNDLTLYELITKFLWPENSIPAAGPVAGPSGADKAGGPIAGPSDENERPKKGMKKKGKTTNETHGPCDADGPSDGSEPRKKGKKKKGKTTNETHKLCDVDEAGKSSVWPSDANPTGGPSAGPSEPRKKGKKKKGKTTNEPHGSNDADMEGEHSTEPSLVMLMRQLNLGGRPSDENQADESSAGPREANEARKKGKKKKGKSAKDPRGLSEADESIGPSSGSGDANQAGGPNEACQAGGSSAGSSNANETPKKGKKNKEKIANDERVLSEADEAAGPSSAPSDAYQTAGPNDADEAGGASDSNKARKKRDKKKVPNK